MGSKRKATLNESLYKVATTISPPFAIQIVVRGKGILDTLQLEKSIARLSDSLPSLNFKLKGKKWMEGETAVRLRQLDMPMPEDWDSHWFRSALDLEEGPSAEFMYFSQGEPCLVFRAPHALMDARGGIFVMKTLFQILRNEQTASKQHFPSDIQIRENLDENRGLSREGYQFKFPSFALAQGHAFQTQVLSLDHPTEGAIAKIASWFSQEFDSACRFLIPVDLRRHESVEEAAANQSLPIYLHAHPGEKWQEIQGRLLESLWRKNELAREAFEKFGLMLPHSFLRWIFNIGIKQVHKKPLYPMSGILSDIGKINLSAFSTPSFQAQSFISIPVFVPLAPFCINVTYHDAQTHIAMTFPKDLAAETLLGRLKAHVNSFEKPHSTKDIEALESREELTDVHHIWADVLEIEVEKTVAQSTFHELGGDSLAFLSMLTEVADQYIQGPATAFLNTAMNTGGHISVKDLIDLIDSTNKTTNKSKP